MKPRLLIGLAITGLVACAGLEARPDLPAEAAAPPADKTRLDGMALAEESAHPGQSGFRLLDDGREAFALRWGAAEIAERSIDVQTYIWHADTTGLGLAHQVLAAADRGVRVRLLIDDMDARAKNAGLASLDTHPQVEVRLFNPFASRSGAMAFLGEAVRSFKRINRRMHNKSWIVDNRIALVGGRNLGDEYFGASEAANFDDLDLAMVGDVVRDVSASFDRFWNSPQAYPIALLDPESVTEANLAGLREKLEAAVTEAQSGWYKDALAESDRIRRMLAGDWPLSWTADYDFVSDLPAKVVDSVDEESSEVGQVLFPAMRAATTRLTVVSPYFVPGERGTAALVEVAQAGTQVRILTNSLAANDVAAVHGGYAARRRDLLEGGVELFEIKPTGGTQVPSSLSGSSGASLHTKALAIDGTRLFVGSYNLDPRSTALNCEQGVLLGNAALAAEFETLFASQTSGTRAWSVSLAGDDLAWTDGTETRDRDPDASAWRRFQAWFARVFGLESQL
jgi:putative cardiolipin synthase